MVKKETKLLILDYLEPRGFCHMGKYRGYRKKPFQLVNLSPIALLVGGICPVKFLIAYP